MILAAAAALALAAETPAAAPWAANPPPRTPERMIPTMERYRFMTDCEMGRDWGWIHELFDTDIGSPEEARIIHRITGEGTRVTGGDHGNDCSIADQMRLTFMLLRGGIADSRYRFVYGHAAIPAANDAIATVAAGANFAWVAFNQESGARAHYDFANCLAERETGAVHRVLMTRYVSREERDAMQALSRRFGSCLAPGQHMRANMLTLRPWLAEAQYQYFRARQPDTVQ